MTPNPAAEERQPAEGHVHVWVLMGEDETKYERFGRPGDRGYSQIATERRRRFYCSGCREMVEDVERRDWREREWKLVA